MDKTKIMVVEDEGIVAHDIARQLTDMGYDVVAIVYSGEEAVEKARELHPDLVLMDIVLAGKMDGIQAAEQINAIADIPVVYLTAYSDEKTLGRAKISGPSGYVLKPVKKRQLNVAIEVALHKHNIERSLKKNEEALRVSQEQLRALAGRLQEVREEERTNISREIHDELGGALIGLKIDFSFLTKSASKKENETVRTSLLASMDSMNKTIDATIQTIRRIAMELRPGILDDLGLVAALEWQLKDFEKRTGIRCEFFPPAKDISLDADLSTALFRIFQEALTNVARHSGATEVHVRLRTDADSPILEVEDNGKGVEEEENLSSKSLGFLGMRERVQMFGGRVTVTGTPGKGTIVTVEIPPVEKRKKED